MVADREGLRILRPDGSTVRLLADVPEGASSPSWSPDGRAIAFMAPTDEGSAIYTIKANGDGLTRLTDSDSAAQPDWSPNGDEIVFWQGLYELHIMGADGSNLRPIGARGFDPAWAPDGEMLAFVGLVGANQDIYTVGADGGGLSRLTTGLGNEREPAWSPDGTKIAYSESPSEITFGCFTYAISPCDSDIYIMNADGSGREELAAEAAFFESSPTWNPKGTTLAFIRDLSSLFTMRADGTGARAIAGAVWDPDWTR